MRSCSQQNQISSPTRQRCAACAVGLYGELRTGQPEIQRRHGSEGRLYMVQCNGTAVCTHRQLGAQLSTASTMTADQFLFIRHCSNNTEHCDHNQPQVKSEIICDINEVMFCRGGAVTVIVLGILAHMIRGDGENVNVTISLGRTSIGHSHRN